MADDFKWDVFLSYSSKDKATVRVIAERLQRDGLGVWLDDWLLRPGDSIPAKIEEGLEFSRVLVLFMSEQALGSDWAQMEAGTFRFRDPLNQGRRFIPVRLDDAPVKWSLAQFYYINWMVEPREQEYQKLREACRRPAEQASTQRGNIGQMAEQASQMYLGSKENILAYSFSPNAERALSGDDKNNIRLWDVKAGYCLRVFEGHTDLVLSVVWNAEQTRALSCSVDGTIRLWNIDTGVCIRELDTKMKNLQCIAWSRDECHALTGSRNGTVAQWDLEEGLRLSVLEGHSDVVWGVAWSPDQRYALSYSDDRTIRIWDVARSRPARVIEGHIGSVTSAIWSTDQNLVISSSRDRTVRVWDVENGNCLHELTGHNAPVNSVALSSNQRLAVSGSSDRTVRVWDLDTGRCLRVLEGNLHSVRAVSWSADQRRAISADVNGGVRLWDISGFVESVQRRHGPVGKPASGQVQYTNAKVLLVGDSSAGKTGLSMRLALNEWKPSDSTVGAWATHWKLPVASTEAWEREIWLWDFGGQADQRIIHQLYMDDTALAVLVFDGQKQDIFESLGQWDHDLMRAARVPLVKMLVAGRVDAGGLRVSRTAVEKFRRERGFECFIETSAKTSLGCEELKQAILAGIRWAEIPWRSSPLLFKRLKDEIVRLKDEGRVLMRTNELRDALLLRLMGPDAIFTDDEMKAVIGLLAGPGVVWELAFGSWVLLQPERINAYAQAVIQTLRGDERETGSIPEDRVLQGDLLYPAPNARLPKEEERFVLLAMHQTLVERGLCLRQHTSEGPLLVFPSYYGRERPDLVDHPAVLVSYRFNGFLDDIYATLVVRLLHTEPFQHDQLWRYAADFRTLTGNKLGMKLTHRAEGVGELEVYFDRVVSLEEKIIFSRYVHEHLLQKAQDVVRLRHYVCPHCDTPVGNREVAMRKLGEGKNSIICVNCEQRIPLWDKLEELFGSPIVQQRVKELQVQSSTALDDESKERVLVGEVISTTALAGQISREYNVSDHGIDMEIEFRDDAGKLTGKKAYLQLKSPDLYEENDVAYWLKQTFPVMVLARNQEGEVRWMSAQDLRKRSQRPEKAMVFQGERFDVMSVRNWRAMVLKR